MREYNHVSWPVAILNWHPKYFFWFVNLSLQIGRLIVVLNFYVQVNFCVHYMFMWSKLQMKKILRIGSNTLYSTDIRKSFFVYDFWWGKLWALRLVTRSFLRRVGHQYHLCGSGSAVEANRDVCVTKDSWTGNVLIQYRDISLLDATCQRLRLCKDSIESVSVGFRTKMAACVSGATAGSVRIFNKVLPNIDKTCGRDSGVPGGSTPPTHVPR